MVFCQKCPTRHAYAWQIGSFWQHTLDIKDEMIKVVLPQGWPVFGVRQDIHGLAQDSGNSSALASVLSVLCQVIHIIGIWAQETLYI